MPAALNAGASDDAAARDIAHPLPPVRLVAASDHRSRRRLGDHLVEHRLTDAAGVERALAEQRRTGGRLGEILLANGLVDATALQVALAEQAGLPSLVPEHEAIGLLDRDDAHRWRAAVLAGPAGPLRGDGPLLVAVTDLGVVPDVRAALGRDVEPRLADERTMDALLAAAYAHDDDREASRAARRGRRTRQARRTAAAGLAALLVTGLAAAAIVAPGPAAAVMVGLCGMYWLRQAGAAARTVRADAEPAGLGRHDFRVDTGADAALPRYSVLLPLSAAGAAELDRLHRALEALDYPRPKLEGVALVDEADRATRRALRTNPLPGWVRIVPVSHGSAGSREALVLYGVRRARGEFVTVVPPGAHLDPGALRRVATGVEPVDQRTGRKLGSRFVRQADRPRLLGAASRRDGAHYRTDEVRGAFGWEAQVPA